LKRKLGLRWRVGCGLSRSAFWMAFSKEPVKLGLFADGPLSRRGSRYWNPYSSLFHRADRVSVRVDRWARRPILLSGAAVVFGYMSARSLGVLMLKTLPAGSVHRRY
jgi:hypothetical protein